MLKFFQNLDWLLILKCFIVGGLICVVGQILLDKTKLTPAKILVLFVTLGAVLGGLRTIPKTSRVCRSRCCCASYRIWKCFSKRRYRRNTVNFGAIRNTHRWHKSSCPAALQQQYFSDILLH